jgi:hypothetical protein
MYLTQLSMVEDGFGSRSFQVIEKFKIEAETFDPVKVL